MGWIQWAIPLVGLAVWILSNLIKNQQDEARRQNMRPRPPEADVPKRREPPPPREVRPRTVERPRPPVRPKPTQAQDRPRPRPEPEPSRSSRRPTPLLEPQIVMAQLVPPPAVELSSPTPTVSANRKPTKAIQNLHALLKNKNTVATAYLLSEVLGKPRCKRKK